MLRSINPASLRTSLVDNAPSHEAMSDPAGFSSLLRQQTQPSAPTPTPSPTVQPPAPQPTPRASTNEAPASHETTKAASEAAPAPAPEHNDTNEPADAAEAPASAQGLAPRPKARNADAATRAAASESPAKAEKAEKAGADAPALSTASCTPQTAVATPTHTVIAEWLGGLQPQRSAPAEKSAASAGEAADSALDAKKAGVPQLGDALAADAATSPRGHVITERSDAAPVFAAALTEHRAAEPPSRGESPAIAPIGAAGLSAPATIARETAGPVVASLPTPIDAPDFAQTLGVQMSVFAKEGVQQAELHLNPADMGPVSVQIVMDGTQARIDFGADVAATRQAIEAGLPELASALRDAGYTLAGGGVSQHAGSRGQHGGSTSPDGQARRGSAKAVSEESVTRVGNAARRIASRGGVDLYA
jgi:flagellar hook-length control protein FliK